MSSSSTVPPVRTVAVDVAKAATADATVDPIEEVMPSMSSPKKPAAASPPAEDASVLIPSEPFRNVTDVSMPEMIAEVSVRLFRLLLRPPMAESLDALRPA